MKTALTKNDLKKKSRKNIEKRNKSLKFKTRLLKKMRKATLIVQNVSKSKVMGNQFCPIYLGYLIQMKFTVVNQMIFIIVMIVMNSKTRIQNKRTQKLNSKNLKMILKFLGQISSIYSKFFIVHYEFLLKIRENFTFFRERGEGEIY